VLAGAGDEPGEIAVVKVVVDDTPADQRPPRKLTYRRSAKWSVFVK